MKHIYNIFAVLALVVMAAACRNYEDIPNVPQQPNTEVGVFGDEMKLCLNVKAPNPFTVDTRAVDPDGMTLQTLTLFCFDENGLFLTTSPAQIVSSSQDRLSGSFSATVPKTTRILHLLANQNMSAFNKSDYLYKSEDEVLSALVGSAGMLIYWARIEAPKELLSLYRDVQMDNGRDINSRTNAEAFVDWLTIETIPTSESHRGVSGKGNPIILLRNQAKFTVVSDGEGEDANDDWKGDSFEVTGFAICNTLAFGTVAPYHTEYGFPTYACTTYEPEFGVMDTSTAHSKHNWLTEKNVTLPERRDMVSDIVDVTTQRELFVFESRNLSTNPVDLILRGCNIVNGVKQEERYYYRVNILDLESEFVEILRNHHYEIHIAGNLTNGCQSFNEAITAPPTNNIWLSISDEVTSVRNNNFILSVDNATAVVEANATSGEPKTDVLKLGFSIQQLDGTAINLDKLKVSWIEDDQKVSSTFNPNLTIGNRVEFNATTGKGEISLDMNTLKSGTEYERASIVVKYGHLQRKIRIILMRTKEFIPTWVSAEVYGGVTDNSESSSNVTVVFTIPNTCPEELFPMDVLVTTNGLDGRAATGQILPIVRDGEDGYGNYFDFEFNGERITDIGYKYKFTVNEPGQHHIYFKNVMDMKNEEVEYVTLEAEYFDYVTKMVTFVDHHNEIVLPNLSYYSVNADATITDQEVVKYILVPQKRFVPVVFDVSLMANGEHYRELTDEEFLLYSSNLDHYADNDIRVPESSANYSYSFTKGDFDCYFKPYNKDIWSTGGRIFGFYPREKSDIWDAENNFQIHMETNKPNSAEVVRIASNQQNSIQVKDPSQLYNGETFRSVTFEVINYRPFRFAAQVNGKGSYRSDEGLAADAITASEVVDNIEFEYLPDETIAVSFDVTSYSAGSGSDMLSINPFGHAFEIFIDAPMLSLHKGMNRSISGANFEDISVEMFNKDSNGNGYYYHKPKLEDLGNGRFVYRVDALNSAEADHWTNWSSIASLPLIIDQTIDPYGERKTIYFKKNSIVSGGTITISANPDQVTYHSKSFEVSNTPIKGEILYVPQQSNGTSTSTPQSVPAGQFVSFTRLHDGSRIGSLTVKAEDENNPMSEIYYELRMRAEYEFNWTNDPIEVMCSIDGKYYSTTLPDLKTLYNSSNRQITLTYVEGQ